MGTQYADLFAALAAEFSAKEVKTRPQGGRQLSYITARTVMNRLDSVLGPENWWDHYQQVNENSVLCSLTIRLSGGDIITKCDAGGCAGMADAGDDDKSGYSDAFKRAAVKFGVGRYLYRDGVPTFAAAATEAPAARPTKNGKPPAWGGDKPAAQAAPTGTPTSGRAFWKWCAAKEKERGVPLVKGLGAWGAKRGFPAKLIDWSPEQVAAGFDAACHRLQQIEPENQTQEVAAE